MTRLVRRSLQVMVAGLVLFLAALLAAMIRHTMDVWTITSWITTVGLYFGGLASAEIADHRSKARR